MTDLKLIPAMPCSWKPLARSTPIRLVEPMVGEEIAVFENEWLLPLPR